MIWGIAVALLWPTLGCHPRWLRRQPEVAAPVVFASPPTKEQVIGAVNANTARIRQLESDVSISVQGLPHLRGNLALERQRRFRLRAGLLGGLANVDLGSNEELFWVWFEQNQPPGVYYARHDQFANSQARQMIPVEPAWLIEALGVVQLDPGGIHNGPYQRTAGKIEIHSQIPTAQGQSTKVTVVHEQYGWVLEQYVYDAYGKLTALCRATQHRYYPREGVTLPQHIEVQLAPGQPTEMAFRIDVGTYRFNQLQGDPQQLWTLPQPEGYPLINVADPRFGSMVDSSPQFAPRHVRRDEEDRRSYRPSYRRAMTTTR